MDHWDTDNPHTHVDDQVPSGLIDTDRAYLTRGMRLRACELASEWLGPRTELEIRRTVEREVGQERWTSLDRALHARAREGLVDLREVPADAERLRQRNQLIARLQRLESMELARKLEPGRWEMRDDAEVVLRRLGERGDIVRTMQRAFATEPRELAIFDPRPGTALVLGRIAAKGIADELVDKGYLIIDGLDGRGHYVTLPPGADLTAFPVGGIADVRMSSHRVADRNIAAMAEHGVYSTDVHRAELRTSRGLADSEEIVARHVRRLEALRRAGIMERMGDGLWRVPKDLVERGRAYDLERSGGIAVTLHSPLPLEKQVRALGAPGSTTNSWTAPPSPLRHGASPQARRMP